MTWCGPYRDVFNVNVFAAPASTAVATSTRVSAAPRAQPRMMVTARAATVAAAMAALLMAVSRIDEPRMIRAGGLSAS
jgi:hypothetical protein